MGSTSMPKNENLIGLKLPLDDLEDPFPIGAR